MELWKGKEVADAITARTLERAKALKKRGIIPTLAIVRVGEKEDDLAYERGAMKRCEAAGVSVRVVALCHDVTQDVFDRTIDALNDEAAVHGILVFQPLPGHLDGECVRARLSPEKDVDGCTASSMAGVYAGSGEGFAPCTAQAVMEMLSFHGVKLAGRKAAVIGRSLVIGRPVAMLLMRENATVVNCHTGTTDVPAITREADILVAAAGAARCVDAAFVSKNQIVIDVGINWDAAASKIVGDVDAEGIIETVQALTPVPGGVGSVTSSVLALHTVEACERGLGTVTE